MEKETEDRAREEERAREMQMERRAEYCRACCAMQAEAEGNENGNLHAGGRRAKGREHGRCAFYNVTGRSRAEIIRRLRLCPGTWNRERADQLCGRRCICGY